MDTTAETTPSRAIASTSLPVPSPTSTPRLPSNADGCTPTSSSESVVDNSSSPFTRFPRGPAQTPFPFSVSSSTSLNEASITSFDDDDACPSPDDKVSQCLKRTFKLNSFRPLQREAIEAVLEGDDVVLRAKTAAGKSLCFQLPAVLLAAEGKGLTIAILPLKALIKDMSERLVSLGISIQVLMEGTPLDLRKTTAIVLATPENLFSTTFGSLQKLYLSGGIARFAIDECHWGFRTHAGFRSSYPKLETLRQIFPRIPIIAMSASLSDVDLAAIISSFKLQTPLLLQSDSFNRPNISYSIKMKRSDQHGLEMLLEFLKERPGECGIIYTVTTSQCEWVAEQLRSLRLKVVVCHGNEEKLTQYDRDQNTARWAKKEVPLMVATTASFNHGVDRSDVRYTVFFALPQSAVDLYQGSSRCGRDGSPSYCVIYFSYADASLVDSIVHSPHSTRATDDLRRMVKILLERKACLRSLILRWSCGEDFDAEDCFATCSNCSRHTPRDVDVTEIVLAVVSLVGAAADRKKPKTICEAVDSLRPSVTTADPSSWSSRKKDLKFVIANLIADRYLVQCHSRGMYGGLFSHLDIGPLGEALLHPSTAEIFSYWLPIEGKSLRWTPKSGEAGGYGVSRDARLREGAYQELRSLRVDGITKNTLLRLARLLPVDCDGLLAMRFIVPGQSAEPLCTWFYESGARKVMLRYHEKLAHDTPISPSSATSSSEIVVAALNIDDWAGLSSSPISSHFVSSPVDSRSSQSPYMTPRAPLHTF